ncbi:MAG: preprotein translocase subunit SecA [Planctomycetota bacterium]
MLYEGVNWVKVRGLMRRARAVAALEGEVQKLSEAELVGKTAAFRERVRTGEKLEAVLPEAFACVREAARRTIGLRHYDVQVAGGVALHRGKAVEMQTGEGKTLAATMPAYLNALTGRGVHIVTVNDYLAKRDTEWMGPIYQFLGLRVGCIAHGMTHEERRSAYRAHVTYGTNKEFAFDYLRDQLRRHASRRSSAAGVFERWKSGEGSEGAGTVQRAHHYAIVDEVDSILIDEARVPLIISDAAPEESPYAKAIRLADRIAGRLVRGTQYGIDVVKQDAYLTEAGKALAAESFAQVAAEVPPGRPFAHFVEQALRARQFYVRDREYLVTDDKVIIVDEFTGRALPDRSWSVGLHQAIQAKEGLPVTAETRTLGMVTFQRYFKLYEKLCGMTGTARSSRGEFRRVFHLEVVSIPTNRRLRRRNAGDLIYADRRRKNEAIVGRILELHAQGRPVLVGTRSVKRNEELAAMLSERGIEHAVLNARQHAEEAKIIARAGELGRVTIATNMAGRGVDIVLGDGVAALGGLAVIGTERHDARRIDLQLGGRAGRQGDLGSFEFYLSFEDDILREWKRGLAARLRWRYRRRSGTPPRTLMGLLFPTAQRSAERKHLNARMLLMEYDEWLEKSKGNLGLPSWG